MGTTLSPCPTNVLSRDFFRAEVVSRIGNCIPQVEVRPIAVTDVLGLPRSGPQDTGSLTSVVQSFLNNVVMVTAGMQQVRGGGVGRS